MKTVNIYMLFFIVVAFILAIIWASLVPSTLDRHADFRDIIRIELPKGIRCVNQKVNTFGRDRTSYDYHLVLQGDKNALLSFIKLLEVTEVERAAVPPDGPPPYGFKWMGAQPMKWWDPPSVRGIECRQYSREYGNFDGKVSSRYYMTHIELTGDKLYLFQSGDIITLRENYERRQRGRREATSRIKDSEVPPNTPIR